MTNKRIGSIQRAGTNERDEAANHSSFRVRNFYLVFGSPSLRRPAVDTRSNLRVVDWGDPVHSLLGAESSPLSSFESEKAVVVSGGSDPNLCVGLHAGWDVNRIAPAFRKYLLLPRGFMIRRCSRFHFGSHLWIAFGQAVQNSGLNSRSMMTGTGPFTLAGVVNVSWISTVMSG